MCICGDGVDGVVGCRVGVGGDGDGVVAAVCAWRVMRWCCA